LKKMVFLFLPLLMVAVSCASAPQNAGVGEPELIEPTAAVVGPEPVDTLVSALEQGGAETALAFGNPGLPETAAPYTTDLEATAADGVPDAVPLLALAEVAETQVEEQVFTEPVLLEPLFYEVASPDEEATSPDSIPDAVPLFALAEVMETQVEEQVLTEPALLEPIFYEVAIPDEEATSPDSIPDAIMPLFALAEVAETQVEEQVLTEPALLEPIFYEVAIPDEEATSPDSIPDAIMPLFALAEVTETQVEEQLLTEPVFYESVTPDLLPAEDFIANSLVVIDLAPEPEPVPPIVVAQEPTPPQQVPAPMPQALPQPPVEYVAEATQATMPEMPTPVPVAVPAPQPIPPQQVPAQIPAPTPQPLPQPVEHLAAATPATVWEHIPIMPEIPSPVPDFLGLPDIIPLADSPVAFSRVVHARAGQWVEVPFRGNGWIFLGETGGQRGIRFDIRRPDSEGQTFVFRADSDGEYTLRFYRRDFVRDVIINDHVQVIVGDTAGTDWVSPPGSVANRVIAERWPNPIDEARILRAAGRLALPDTADTESLYPVSLAEETQVAMPPAAVPAPTPQIAPEPTAPAILPPPVALPPTVAPLPAPAPVPVPPPVPAGAILQPPVLMPEPLILDTLPGLGFGSPFDLLPMAMEEFGAGRVAEAISLLDLFRELYPSGTDELWWLLGQFFEADSPSRNILNALGYYRRLVREFPQSSRLSDARSRIAFLERFFLNIR